MISILSPNLGKKPKKTNYWTIQGHLWLSVWHKAEWLVPPISPLNNTWLPARLRPIRDISTITSCPTNLIRPCVCVCVHLAHFYPAHKAPYGNGRYQQRCHDKVLGFQLISATAGSSFLSDAAGRLGDACPCLCQIKGQCLDGEATPLFIPV